MERRRSRDSFTKTLKRICRRIDSQRVFDVSYRYDFLPDIQRSKLTVNALWVAGSYARGALTCGDLDLVADITAEEGGFPLTPTISRAVIASPPDVRLYVGTPEENSSRVPFPEARLVWTPARDFDAEIDAIPVDPAVTRFERRHDVLPLRREQISEPIEEDIFERIVDLIEKQILSSAWVPLDEIKINMDTWSPEAAGFFKKLQRCCGQATQKISPYIIQWFMDNSAGEYWHRDYDEKRQFRVDGAEVFVGRPFIRLNLLDELSCSKIVIVPHVTRRGPNGLWFLSRGKRHPLINKFKKCSAYYLANEDRPDYIIESQRWMEITSLELYTTRGEAEKRRQENVEEFDIELVIKNASAVNLLELMSMADVIDIDSVRYPLTRDGQHFDEFDKTASADEIANALLKKQ